MLGLQGWLQYEIDLTLVQPGRRLPVVNGRCYKSYQVYELIKTMVLLRRKYIVSIQKKKYHRQTELALNQISLLKRWRIKQNNLYQRRSLTKLTSLPRLDFQFYQVQLHLFQTNLSRCKLLALFF